MLEIKNSISRIGNRVLVVILSIGLICTSVTGSFTSLQVYAETNDEVESDEQMSMQVHQDYLEHFEEYGYVEEQPCTHEHTNECYAESELVCQHVHDEECGYMKERPCTHEHTNECYAESELVCQHVHDEECGYMKKRPCTHEHTKECYAESELVCRHFHDEGCGYAEEQPCTSTCIEKYEQQSHPKEIKLLENDDELISKSSVVEQGTLVKCICTSLCEQFFRNDDCPICKNADAINLTRICMRSTIWDGTASFSLQGEGTADKPYQIINAQDLERLRLLCANGESFAGKYVKLENDIYMNPFDEMNNYTQWDTVAPLNEWKGIDGFGGSFDGSGHTIYGLYINRNSDNTGLFNSIETRNKTIIKNLTLSNFYVKGTGSVGAIIGKGLWVYILNCEVKNGIVQASGNNVGGLLGLSGSPSHFGTTIKNSSNYASVYGYNYVGGILGYTYIGNNLGIGSENVGGKETITLSDLVNYGTIQGNINVGGIAGFTQRNMNCGGMCSERLINYASVNGTENVGGIFGNTQSYYHDSNASFLANKGNITGSKSIGGIAGKISVSDNNLYRFNNCYNTGEVVGNYYAGGITGYASNNSWWGGEIKISCCYNIGNAKNGLTGFGQGCSFEKSYYIGDNAGTTGNSILCIDETFEGDVSKFAYFDFSNDWKMTDTYPIFRWQEGEEIDTPENSVGDFVVYTSSSDCNIGVGQQLEIKAVVEHKGVPVMEPDAYSYEISDTDVISIEEVKYDEYGPTIILGGKKVGTSRISFYHIPTAKKVTIQVVVQNDVKTYDIENIATIEYGDTVDKWIIHSHMAFDDFHIYKNIDDSYTVTFDAYNRLQHYGAVEVYDENGKRVQVERIEKREEYEGNLKEVWESATNLWDSFWTVVKDLTSEDNLYREYRDPLLAKKTDDISVIVPNGGYIVISNDYTKSFGSLIFNTVDIAFAVYDITETFVDTSDLLIKGDDWFKAISKEGQFRTIDEFSKKGMDKEFMDKFINKIGEKSFDDKITLSVLSSLATDITEIFENVIKSLGEVDYAEVLESSAESAGFHIVQNLLERFGGPAGAALQLIFVPAKHLNIMMQCVHFVQSKCSGSVIIKINGTQDIIVSNGIIIENVQGMPIICNKLRAEEITSKAEYQYILRDFQLDKQLQIYDITMYRNDVPVQPQGTIRVSIPIPSKYNPDSIEMYRAEDDGTYTKLRSSIEEGRIVFYTTHLSIYICVGELVKDSISSPDNTPDNNYTVPSDNKSINVKPSTNMPIDLIQKNYGLDDSDVINDITNKDANTSSEMKNNISIDNSISSDSEKFESVDSSSSNLNEDIIQSNKSESGEEFRLDDNGTDLTIVICGLLLLVAVCIILFLKSKKNASGDS